MATSLLLVGYAVQLAVTSRSDELELVRLGANVPELVRAGEWFRLATATLLHGGFVHLASNALPLLLMGEYLERVLGHARTLLVLVAAALGGAIGSLLFANASMSVGGSTVVYGVVGGVVYLLTLRRAERPAGAALPAAIAVALIALELLFGARGPVDRAAHAFGFLTGFGTTTALAHGRPLAGLAARRSRPLAGAAALGAALFAALLVQGGVRAGDESAVLHRWIAARIERGGLGAIELNNHAYLLALAPEIDRSQLELARDRVAALSARHADLHGLVDTLASLHFRLDELARAIEVERGALASAPDAGYAAKLAGFELALEGTAGAYRVGIHSDFELTLRLVEGVLELEAGRPVPRGTLVHACALTAGRTIALLEFRLPTGARTVRLDAPPELLVIADQIRLVVTLVDTRSDEAVAAPALRIWPIDPSASPLLLALPPAKG